MFVRVRSRRFSSARRVTAALTVLVVTLSLAASSSLPQPSSVPRGPVAAPLPVGELPDRRTETSATRRNRDGSMTTTVYSTPVHFRAADGSWQPVDTGLHETRDGGFAWRSGANVYEMLFRTAAGEGFAEFRLGNRKLRMDALGTRGAAGSARVDGSQITYPDAYAGADLRYAMDASGVRKVIDLAGPDSATSYTFRLSPVDGGPGLSAQRRPDGSYAVRAGAGEEFTLDAPVVWEGSDVAPQADAKPVLTVQPGGTGLLVTLALDGGWLRAPGRVFPVHLDPSITIQPHQYHASWPTSGGSAVADIRVGSSASATYRAGVQFSLSSVPPNVQVNSATLGMYFNRVCIVSTTTPCANSHTVDVHRMTSAWTAASTFAQIGHDTTVSGSATLAVNAPAGWISWPVTGLVSSWVSGTQPNYGLLLKRRTETLGSNGPASLGQSPFPKLDITYTVIGPDVQPPATLHADGAELAWAPSATGSGTAGYEVHRATSATFTPGPTTLIAAVGDRAVTAFRDTTAAAGGTFSYKVKDLSDGTVSAARTVVLPATGRSTKVLQPGPGDGQGTQLASLAMGCNSYGASPTAEVGDQGLFGSTRYLQKFDLRDIPPGATVDSATMSLSRSDAPLFGMDATVYRVTRPWSEGTGTGQCTGGGATFVEASPGVRWTTGGGDYAASPAATATVSCCGPGVDTFDLTALVRSWVLGTAPNHGVLLIGENAQGSSAHYATDDHQDPTLRPKLTVSYQDGSAAEGARVALASPGTGAKVSGSVVLTAAAEDDRRVDRVDFLVGGSTVATDTAAPFTGTWNTVPGGNGTKTITVQATDDAGNVTTSPPVSVVVDNTQPPTISVTAPAAGFTATGDVVLTANPADDVGVASVVFLVDGVRVGDPITTAPWSTTWKTLNPLDQVFNGAHQLSAVVTDTSGQQVSSPAQVLNVNNRGTSNAKVDFVLNDPATTVDDVFPSVMAANTTTGTVQDPYAPTAVPRPDGTSGGSLNRALGSTPSNDGGTPPGTCPADAYCATIRVTNRSGVTWTSSSAAVWYRWYAPNGAIMFEGKSTATFPATFPDAMTAAFPLTIVPPALPPGVEQGTYGLRVDIYDPATATWFAARGQQPLDNPVLIVKSLATKLGLERYYQYDGESVGAGMSSLTNIANGNMLWRWSPFFAPGRGLASMVDLTYNSLEDHSKSPAGNNVSLSMSGLIRLGVPLDIHPNKADEISGRSNKWVESTDGDGTTHRFTGTVGTDGITRWQEPPGVNLYLRSLPIGDSRGRWALTRPDKVTFFFDPDGFPTLVEDRNGNRITFTVLDTPPGEDPGGPKKRITAITDAGNRSFTIDYWSKDEIKKAHVRGKIQSISDHSGSRLDFDYYDDGNLLRLTQRGGTNADGTFLADRSFTFTYTTSSGAGPAIGTDDDAGAAARANPPPKTANQSTRLYSVSDPRGNETRFAYYQANDGQFLRWKLKSRIARHTAGAPAPTTGYEYDLTNRITTVKAPLARDTRFSYDPTGKVVQIVNPKNETTGVEWTADFKVSKLTEPSTMFSTYTYNNNGYLLTHINQAGEKTELTYFDSGVDANDTDHLSLLATVTKPRGTVTTADPTDFRWQFSYDPAGNLDKVTDPTNAITDYDYNLAGSPNPGTVAQIKDANGNPPTVFEAYDPSGQPTRMRDPLGGITRIGYDVDGLARWIQDPNHAAETATDERAYKTFFDYDAFHRLGRQSAPKSTTGERGTLLFSGMEFDANDNVTQSFGSHYGSISGGDPGGGAVTITSFDVRDRPILVTGPDRSSDPAGERVRFEYDLAGRMSKVEHPKGVQSPTVSDYTTVYDYDVLDRVSRTTVYGTSTAADQTRSTHTCYDLAGDLRSVTAPRAGLATVTCPGTGPATVPFTSTVSYDQAHRPVTRTDPLGHQSRVVYDLNGNMRSVETDIAPGRVARQTTEYDQRDKPVEARQRFDGTTGRELVARMEYDKNGNLIRQLSPRAVDAANGGTVTNYVNELRYDALNRVTRALLPFDARDNGERQYVHRSYDANGNLTWASLPVTAAEPATVGDGSKTFMTYFDPGWIRTSDDPVNPKVHFDYNALGQQVMRVAELRSSPGTLDTSHQMLWEYYVDGPVKSRADRGGQFNTYQYDAHNLLTVARDGGVTDSGQTPVDIEATYTGFDESAKARYRKVGTTAWTFAKYTYDANGNVTNRKENGEETGDNILTATQTKPPREYRLAYDNADWLIEQLDMGTDTSDAACKDDTRTVNAFWGNGKEKQRDIYRAGTGCSATPSTWPKKQTTTWTHFDNGLLRQMETRNGSGAVTESHDIGYFDANDDFVNGNRTRDRYVLERENVTGTNAATTCRAGSPCDAVYEYDARDRLIRHQQRAGKQTTYTLDQPTQLIGDQTIRAGNVTTEVSNGATTTKRYTTDRLTDITIAGVTAKYWYDEWGNLDCVTTTTGSAANCNPPEGGSATNLIADYVYDYLNRLNTSRLYNGSTVTDSATYVYDALDRTVLETEDHANTVNDRRTTFSFQGLSRRVTEEKQEGGSNPKTKTYAYDAYGHRLTMTDANNTTGAVETFTYGSDAHGSISQLINDAGKVRASYGYSAYGGSDAPPADGESLTTGDTENQTPLNPYRYSGKRMDSGTVSSTAPTGPAGFGAYDMGARRFGPDMGSFFQADAFSGALADLGLALDPLTQNRYGLAGGNPISYMETDGHMALADGGGGGSGTANPQTQSQDSGAERFLKTAWNDFWGGVKGTGTLVKDSFRCEYTDNQEGCNELNDQLKRQFTTAEGWKETWHSVWDPIRNDCTSKERIPECGGHIASAAFEALLGRGIGRLTKLGLPSCHSFALGTLVLLANGKTKRIEDVRVGDEVVATDPETGKTSKRKVTRLHSNEDRDLTDMVVRAEDGTEQTLHTTQNHPFWSVTRREWVEASALRSGELLRTAAGPTVMVLAVTSFAGERWMRDLTVDGVHAYYVLAGRTPVLVHNNGPCEPLPNKRSLEQQDLELDAAAKRGIRPGVLGPGSGPGGLDAATGGADDFKWAVVDNAGTPELRVIPAYAGGGAGNWPRIELAHTVLAGRGGTVLAAGSGMRMGDSIFINNYSGHFTPSAATLPLGEEAFRNAGIDVEAIPIDGT